MLLTWRSMVRSLRHSSSAISLLVLPGRDQAQARELARGEQDSGAGRPRRVRRSRRARSGCAPSRSNTAFAASNSSRAASSSPSARHAASDEHAHARRLVRRLEALPRYRTRGAADRAPHCASPSAMAIAPSACATTARRASASNASRQLSQFVARASGVLEIAGREHDLEVGRQEPGAPQPIARGAHQPADRRACAPSVRPCASRSSASPGCGSNPRSLAAR